MIKKNTGKIKIEKTSKVHAHSDYAGQFIKDKNDKNDKNDKQYEYELRIIN